jgi:hypothetical protein
VDLGAGEAVREESAATSSIYNGLSRPHLALEAGFIDLAARTLEIAIPLPDGETYWRFTRSHGAGMFINALPDDKRTEFHDRLVAAVDTAGEITMRRSATLWLARRP